MMKTPFSHNEDSPKHSVCVGNLHRAEDPVSLGSVWSSIKDNAEIIRLKAQWNVEVYRC